MNLYDSLIEASCEIDHHESTLYVKVTPESTEIVNAAYHRGDISTVSTFRSQIDGCMWYDVPFGYKPFCGKNNIIFPTQWCPIGSRNTKQNRTGLNFFKSQDIKKHPLLCARGIFSSTL